MKLFMTLLLILTASFTTSMAARIRQFICNDCCALQTKGGNCLRRKITRRWSLNSKNRAHWKSCCNAAILRI